MDNSLSRRVGIEMEGYLDSYPGRIELIGAKIGKDGSLSNDDWDEDDEAYGVEIRTEPLTSLDVLDEIWRTVKRNGWDVDSCAGTHIHVEVNDFTTLDKVKLLRFGIAIERIIFMFVENYRNGNDYCNPLHKQWRLVFREKSKHAGVEWNNVDAKNLNYYLSSNFRTSKGKYQYDSMNNGKYDWMNVLESDYPTVEFRLFHAMKSVDEIKKQAKMAVAICDLVKNATIEQLEFIISELYRQPSVEAVIDKYFEVLGLDFKLEPVGHAALSYMEDKIKKQTEEVAV